MAPEGNRLCLRCPAVEENVAVARALVAAVAANLPFTLPEVEELRIATSEAMSNAVLHAYRQAGPDDRAARTPGEVELVVAPGPDGVRVWVRDFGCGIVDIDEARRPEVSSLEGHLGLGFAFMQAMAEGLSVESRPGEGTTVAFVKRTGGGGAGDAAPTAP